MLALRGAHREAGRVDDLCAVGAFHQEEAGVARVVLVGLLADLTHRRQGEAGLQGARGEAPSEPATTPHTQTGGGDTLPARES